MRLYRTLMGNSHWGQYRMEPMFFMSKVEQLLAVVTTNLLIC